MTWLLNLAGGIKAKLIAAAAALAAIGLFALRFFLKGKAAGRQQAETKQRRKVQSAKKRKARVDDPGDRGSIDRMRDGKF